MASVAPALPEQFIRLGVAPESRPAAIAQACQLLVAAGCVAPAYEKSMLRREDVANTFLGHGVAIPHGLGEDRNLVLRDGIAILQVPAGLDWNPGQRARLVVAIAARSDSHIEILRRLTRLMQDEERLEALFTTTDSGEIAAALAADGPAAPTIGGPAADLDETWEWTVDYPAGLHARPASAWVAAARACQARLQVRHGAETADPRNLVALLRLGLKQGDRITVSAAGQDAAAALAALRATATGLSAGEKADAAAAAKTAPAARGWTPPGDPLAFAGVAASPGLAIGRIHVLSSGDAAVSDHPAALSEGGRLLHEALTATGLQMKALIDDTSRRLGAGDAAIFKAQAELLRDTDLITLACQIMVEGHGVAWSWNQAVERMAAQLSALGNPVLAARAADLRDVGRRVLTQIDPSLKTASLADPGEGPAIIVAADLSPSDTAGLDPARVAGLATAQGGPTSHTAILARTLGLPALVGGGEALLQVTAGAAAILDGDGGRLYLDPPPEALDAARAFIEEQAERRRAEEEKRGLPAVTLDGVEIAIGANVNTPDQVAFALAQGAEGVGLMRTEFLFLERGDTPDEEEQYRTYCGMIERLGDRPLVVRALDIGGDKQVAHLQLPHEDNPFLGVRGARLLLRRPDLMEPQLRALYRAAARGGKLSIMFPMITSVSEVLALRGHCERVRADVGGPQVPLGIMIEVPAAAVQADVLAAHVDFFSIGTNDLTQYTLAMDRQNPVLAAEADSLHPAVLRLIRQTVEGAARHGGWVGVCGGLAGDPFGACLLTGLGVTELSMTPREVPAVKARLRHARAATLKDLAARALSLESAAEVRALEAQPA